MNVKDFVEEMAYFHPHADAWVVTGQDHQGRHIVGWRARQSPETVIDPQRYLDRDSAHLKFTAIIENDDVPKTLIRGRDWQVRRVYNWEEKSVMTFGKHLDTPAKAKRLMRAVSEKHDIECPDLVWNDIVYASEYDAGDNSIEFGDRNSIVLLHEMAHAIHAQMLVERMGPDHSPGFVGIAIALYHHFGKINRDFLVQTAHEANLLGDLYAPKKDAKSGPRPAEYIFR